MGNKVNSTPTQLDRIGARLGRKADIAGARSKAKRVDSESKATLIEARVTYSVK